MQGGTQLEGRKVSVITANMAPRMASARPIDFSLASWPWPRIDRTPLRLLRSDWRRDKELIR